jgi:Ca-activated chloride channel homolog
MIRRLLLRPALFALVFALLAFTFDAATGEGAAAGRDDDEVTQGSLRALDSSGRPAGECPLKHTAVRAEVSGFISRVTVTQEFENPFEDKIEAVYVFPLPQAAAVDDMTMLVGGRMIKARIMRRDEAQAAYQEARSRGNVASLLEQERPNIFTQSVANILPGQSVRVVISYVETLKYEAGAYEWSFPMVVGKRYMPSGAGGGSRPTAVQPQESDSAEQPTDAAAGQPEQEDSGTQQQEAGGAQDSDARTTGAARVNPPHMPKGMRAGHDISIEVSVDAGVPLEAVTSRTHEIEVERSGAGGALVRLKGGATIPNKDFHIKYDVAGGRIEDAVLAHASERGRFFTLILQPPDRIAPAQVVPKELVFVLDTSGSMEGLPIEKAKETMRLALEGLYPQDTFNLITFAGDTHVLFDKPVPATPANLAKARRFLETRNGVGGTEMMKAIRAALDPSDAQGHLRIVCFMTDGYVGNDFEIISEVQKHPNARVFSFGVGSSVNRFLLDKMAEHGLGAVDYVSLDEDGGRAARRFHERVRNPLLTDIYVDWGSLHVADVYPRRVPDLFGAAPLILSGRYTAGGRGVVRLRGRMAGQAFEREIAVELPESQPGNEVLATLWARRRVEDLLSEDYEGTQRGETREDLRETITSLGLEYRLMTQFTSFVAVEEMTFTDGGKPRRVEVPVEVPEGVSPQDAFGVEGGDTGPLGNFGLIGFAAGRRAPSARALSVATGGGVGYILPYPPSPTPVPGAATVVSGGVLNGKVVSKPQPVYPPIAKAARAQGTVTVQIVVDEAGRVVSARAVGGHPLLQQAAVAAAQQARFAPTLMSGQPVKVSGVITYNFALAGGAPKVSSTLGGATTAQADAEEQWRQRLRSKMHPLVAAFVQRLRDKNETAGTEEATFIRDGKAELRLRLSEKSPAVLARLKQLGFELVLDPQSSRFVIGRLPVEKLAALLEDEAVLYISPQQQ